jgi:hypothetical protein
MPMLEGRKDLGQLRLRPGTSLTVLAGQRPIAAVDLHSFRASRPAAAPPESGAGGGGFPWVLAAALLGVAALSAGLRLRLRSPSAA